MASSRGSGCHRRPPPNRQTVWGRSSTPAPVNVATSRTDAAIRLPPTGRTMTQSRCSSPEHSPTKRRATPTAYRASCIDDSGTHLRRAVAGLGDSGRPSRSPDAHRVRRTARATRRWRNGLLAQAGLHRHQLELRPAVSGTADFPSWQPRHFLVGSGTARPQPFALEDSCGIASGSRLENFCSPAAAGSSWPCTTRSHFTLLNQRDSGNPLGQPSFTDSQSQFRLN